MEQPFKRRRVSLRDEETFKAATAYGLRPKWNNYDLEKETNRGRQQPLPKGTQSGALDGINLPLNPFEPPHKALYPGNEIEIHRVLHPRNLTQRRDSVSPTSTAVVSVVQVDIDLGDSTVTQVFIPPGSSVVSLSGLAPLTLNHNQPVPSSSPPVLPFSRASSSPVAPQSTQTSATPSQAVPSSTPSASSTPPVSSSPSASASRPTTAPDYAASSVASSLASISTSASIPTSMTLNLQRLSSQEVLSPSPSSPLPPPSPSSSLGSSSESASFFPSSAGASSQSSATQTPSSSKPPPTPNSSTLSATRTGNLSLLALLSANARPTRARASTVSTVSSFSSSKQTTSANSQSSPTTSGISPTPSTTTTTSPTTNTPTASRSSSLSRSRTSLSSSGRRTSTSASKSTSTSSRSTSRPSSFTTSSTSQPSETLASSPTITSGGTASGGGGYGGVTGTGSETSASSTATVGAGAGSGGGLTPTNRAVVGGVVGGLAGLSIVFLLLLLLIRWRRNKARLQRPMFSPLPQSIPPGETGQGSSMTERSSAAPLAAGSFFKRLRPHSGQTAATTDTGPSERGFQNFGGRKLESVLSSRGDGYGEPGPSSASGPAAGFGSTPSVARGQGFGHSPGPSEPETLSGSSFYRDSQGFYGGKEADSGSVPSSLMVGPSSPPRSSPTYPPPPAGGIPPEGFGGATRATSEIAVMRPGPARTPVTNQPGFIPMRNPPRPPRSTPSPRPPRSTPSSRTGPISTSPVPRPPDELGRSHPSFDGSRGSRFTEEV